MGNYRIIAVEEDSGDAVVPVDVRNAVVPGDDMTEDGVLED